MKTNTFSYQEFVDILQAQTPCVLATVLQTYGSTPQKAGSSAIIGINHLLAGTVGGGMTELKVIKQAQLSLESHLSGIFSFDLSGDIAKGSESLCGGGMTILLDVAPDLHLPVFMQLKKSLDERQKGVLLTLIDNVNPKEIKISRHWYSKTNHPHLTDELRSKIEPLIGEMLELPHNDTSRFIPLKKLGIYQEGYLFLECIVPKPSLIIAGAGHIGQSLAHLGKFLGFSVTVWDDRPEYATKSQVPDADFVLSGIVDSLADQLQIGDDSYLVIVTHGHKGDTEVLRKFISSKSAYIGMIGSKAKVAQVKMSFLDNEWATPEQWERIYTPIGLDIGAQSVEDIAVSIAAQLVKVRNQKHTPQ